MPLQIRRGSTAQRLTITPLPGELIYDTTTGELFVGDGATVGGAITTGVSLEDVRDTAAGLLTSGIHTGITFNYNDTLNRIDATVTIGGTGPFDGDINGSVFADDSTILVDGTDGGAIKGKLSVSGNEHTITTGIGQYTFLRESRLSLNYTTGSTSSDHGIVLNQYASDLNSPKVTFIRGRGNEAVPTALQTNDNVGEVLFAGFDGSILGVSARVRAIVENTPTPGLGVPTSLRFAASRGNGILYTTAILTSNGNLQVNGINSLTTTPLNVQNHMLMNSQRSLRFGDADTTNYIGFQAPSTVTSNVLFTLPGTDGGANNVLTTNGSATLGWSSISSLLPNPFTNQLQANVLASDSSTIIDHTSKTITADTLNAAVGGNLKVSANIELRNQNGIRFGDSDSSNFIILVAPSNLASNTFFTLPSGDGGAGNVMLTNGNGQLYFDNVEDVLPEFIRRDIIGSVYGDDSTLLVDGTVTGKIVGPIQTSSLRTSETSIVLGDGVGSGNFTVGVGYNAGFTGRGDFSIAIGAQAGETNQGYGAISLGRDAGYSGQGNYSIAIGFESGITNQGAGGIAIGYGAADNTQGIEAIAIGTDAGSYFSGVYSTSIGFEAGKNNQGNYGVAIGYRAGKENQHQQSIVINGTNSELNTAGAGLFVAPVRSSAPTGSMLNYDTSTKEVTYSSILQIPVTADDAARLAAIPSPAAGMVIFMQSGTAPAATNQLQVFDGSAWVNV